MKRVAPCIAERRPAEKRLGHLRDIMDHKPNEEIVRAIVDLTPDCVKVIARDGTVLFVNSGGIDMAGAPSADVLVGRNFFDFLAPEDRDRYREFHEKVCSGHGGVLEFDIVRLNGERRHMETRAAPLRNSDGTIVQLGVTRDITPRKQAEEKLRRSEAFLTEAQRLSSTGSFSWRVSRDEMLWSDQMYRIFEFDLATHATIELMRSRVHREDIVVFNEFVERARQGCETLDYEYRLQVPDRSVKYVHLIARGISSAAVALEYIGAVQDVTERRVSEEALAKARSELARVARLTTIGVLGASIAHEINQPLAAIVASGNACRRWLETGQDLGRAKDSLNRLISDANRASDVIERVRSLTKRRAPEQSQLNINDVVEEVLTLTRGELQAHGVSVCNELGADLPAIKGDRVQLQQVVLNLTMNAIDAMSTNTDRQRILTVRSRLNAGGGVLITVQDSGEGLDPRSVDRIFEAFFTTKPDGMGMGLSIASSIVEIHGGRLWASAGDPHGTAFHFTLSAPDDRVS